jgi:hypothetical protein
MSETIVDETLIGVSYIRRRFPLRLQYQRGNSPDRGAIERRDPWVRSTRGRLWKLILATRKRAGEFDEPRPPADRILVRRRDEPIPTEKKTGAGG